MKKLAFLIIGLLFIACKQEPQPPKWYTQVYQDNNKIIYGTGEGKTKKAAINAALANISSKIAVVVQSKFQSIQHQYQDNETSEASSSALLNIQTKTNPIIFTDYKVLKIQKKDKYYALVKVDRYKNAKYMCENTYIPSINDSDLNLLFNYKKILAIVNKNIDKLKNINAVYPLCENKLKESLSLRKNLINKYNHLSFKVSSNDNKLKNLIESVLKIKSSPNGKIKIYALSRHKTSTIGNYKIYTIYINLKVKHNNYSKSFNITCASSSIGDYNLAKELAYKDCEEKIKNIFDF